MRWMMFIKHLQSLPLAEAGKAIAALGFEGVDLTVRPGGSIAPEHVKTGLPEAIAILKEQRLIVPLITTSIVDAGDSSAHAIFETAARCDVRELKLGYVPIRRFGTLGAEMDRFQRALDGIEALSRQTGVRASLHTHSGAYLTANPAIVWWLIKDRDPSAIGAYVDPGHMFVEGGDDGWRLGLDLLHTRISLVAIKDMLWKQVRDDRLQKNRWVTQLVPLDRGAVPWTDVFAALRNAGFDGWISVHSEYQGKHSWQDLTTGELVEQTGEDLAYLRRVLAPQGVAVPGWRDAMPGDRDAAPAGEPSTRPALNTKRGRYDSTSFGSA